MSALTYAVLCSVNPAHMAKNNSITEDRW
jgi:hypothetical protein